MGRIVGINYSKHPDRGNAMERAVRAVQDPSTPRADAASKAKWYNALANRVKPAVQPNRKRLG
jgi:hypothetical protein